MQLINLDARNQELVQEMERVRSELERTKIESANSLKNQIKTKCKVCQELERALKKMSKSEAHDELLKVQLDNNVSQLYMLIIMPRGVAARGIR